LRISFWKAHLHIERVTFPEIALLAFCSKVVINRFSTFRPWQYVIDMQLNAWLKQRATTTGLAPKTVSH
jgi:hypothetical protein